MQDTVLGAKEMEFRVEHCDNCVDLAVCGLGVHCYNMVWFQKILWKLIAPKNWTIKKHSDEAKQII